MSKDRFKIDLKCPSCARSGVASAEEEDGWSYVKGNKDTYIFDLPNGFKIVDKPSRMASVDIFCAQCDVSAIV